MYIAEHSIVKIFTKKKVSYFMMKGAPKVGAAGLQHLPQNQNFKYTVILNVLHNLLFSRDQKLKSDEKHYNTIRKYITC